MTFLKLEDYVIFVLCLISSLGIGLFYAIRNRSKQITTKRFILGDGKMAIIPVAFSMMVTFESGIMMLGIPAEVYMYGMQWYMSSIAGFVSHMLCLHILIPSLKQLNVTSVNHVNYLGTVTFVPAVTLEMVAGIPVWISVTTLMGVVVVYTIIGGLTAVIWTDVLQAILMFGGMIAIIFKLMVKMVHDISKRTPGLPVLLFGGIALLVTFVISGIEGPISRILDITGACFAGAKVGVYVLGWFIPRANALGGFVGGLVCVLFVGWISVGKLISSGVRVNAKLEPASTENCPLVNISGFTNGNIYEQMMTEFMSNDTDSIAGAKHMTVTQGPQGLDVLYSLSYKWLLPIGICLVVGVGALVSRLQARKPVDPSLIVPVCDYLCCCIPERIRKKFRCGIKYPGRDEVTAQNEETAVQLIEMEPITDDISVRK
ncbi:sodium-dependent multivitamin transporter-like [Mizuhopecten yessoensis]|uniref:sodium-dependent multivitamin transporter-like n=1 Tax=Mizuhopecten yessoensis TaxID=6573 RepID=UPI000B45A919|nr:sodium-dependent multivitamin transporter-like [Mizuhopecten yessoensis]